MLIYAPFMTYFFCFKKNLPHHNKADSQQEGIYRVKNLAPNLYNRRDYNDN